MSPGPIETLRVFLGWDAPALPLAVRWFTSHCLAWPDLSKMVVVVPGARAGRRLIELLASAGAGRSFGPPTIVTPGQLPELLYTQATPLAEELHTTLAWMHAIRAADAEALKSLMADPPEQRDFHAQQTLAKQLASLHESLAAEGIAFAQVPRLCRAMPEFRDDRWEVLADLQERYHAALAAAGVIDRHAAREDDAAAPPERPPEVVLLAVSELGKAARRLLARTAGVVALVHAPESEAAGFDAMGCVLPAYWNAKPLAVPDEVIRVVDQPREQVAVVIDALMEVNGEDTPRFAADEITVGVGDSDASLAVELALKRAGLPARAPAAGSVDRSPPAMFLRAFARFVRARRFDDLASLLRHPDAEAFVTRSVPQTTEGVGDWLGVLDRYINDHLQRRLSASWLGDHDGLARLKAVHDAVLSLAPGDHAAARPLPTWSECISRILIEVYRHTKLSSTNPAHAPSIRSLHDIGEQLRSQAVLSNDSPLTPSLSLPDAIDFTLATLAQTPIPSDAREPAVEVLNWLELHLDDAPVLLVTGFAEGFIPESVSSDPFLPDATRRTLGLPDNAARFARDAYWLTSILRSRPHVRLIAPRRGDDDQPLPPSRLLLSVPREELAARVMRFTAGHAPRATQAALLGHGGINRFDIPRPVPPTRPIDRLRVTAFRDYLACPYRFYLRHVLGLEVMDDRAIELGPPAFGNLAHDVLASFAVSDLAESSRAEDIEAMLASELQRIVARRYGKEPPAVVAIQREMLRQRFVHFARWQATQPGEGWRITPMAEKDLAATMTVDGASFTITGRVDRVDQHPEHGLRVLDYKTSETAEKPDKRHRHEDEWIDLQLPLYRTLIRANRGEETLVRLGYVNLGKTAKDVCLHLAEWDDATLRGAEEKAAEVIRKVRDNVFWPPSDDFWEHDDFARICMNGVFDRPALSERGAAR